MSTDKMPSSCAGATTMLKILSNKEVAAYQDNGTAE
jgi:hypothetical protein